MIATISSSSLYETCLMVADPVSIDIDDQGRIYYTRTNRQKDSEFDIRGHQDWEIGSIQLSTIHQNYGIQMIGALNDD